MAATIDTSNGSDSNVTTLKQHLLHQQDLAKSMPPIPHITANFIPFKDVITSLVSYANAEFRNILETLPATASDISKKRRLLDYVVNMKIQFTKLYVLAKWVKVSKDISTTIDVVAWLHGQRLCFDNVIESLRFIEKTLGGAKLRNPDLETALEVFTAGRPSLLSRGYITVPKLSPSTILQTLYDLNILLSIRLALTEKLPPEFSHYDIANGKVTFYVENSYQIQFGIADDSVDARFFLIDFQFDFPGSHALVPSTKLKLENLANNLLLTKGLTPTLRLALLISQNYKLAMIYRELVELGKGLYYGLIVPKFQPDKSLVTVKYWVSSKSRNKNVIEIGLRKSQTIGIRWQREGKIITDHNIEFGQENISAEWLLQQITTLHVQHNVSIIYALLYKSLGRANLEKSKPSVRPPSSVAATPTPSDGNQFNTPNTSSPTTSVTPGSNQISEESNQNDIVTLVSPEKIKLFLTHSKFTIFSIDKLTGRTILTNSTKIISSFEAGLNDVSDKSQQVTEILLKLRYVSIQEEIMTKARSAGWIAKAGMSFTAEVIKTKFAADTKQVFCLRQSSWPSMWFLLVTIGANSIPRWWLTKLIMKEGNWNILFKEELPIKKEIPDHFEYKLFKDLSTFTVSHIKTEALCKELDENKISYKVLQTSTRGLMGASSPVILINMKSLTTESWAEESLFLRLIDENSDKTIAIMQGRAKQSLDVSSMSNENTKMDVDLKTGIFTLKMTLPETCSASNTSLSLPTAEFRKSDFVDSLVKMFTQIERIVGYVNLLKSLSTLQLKETSMSKISFEYGPSMLATINLQPEASMNDDIIDSQSLSKNATFTLDENSPHLLVQPFLQSMLNNSGLLSVVWVLQTALPMYVALKEISDRAERERLNASNSNEDGSFIQLPVIITPHSVEEIHLFFVSKKLKISVHLMQRNGRPLEAFISDTTAVLQQIQLQQQYLQQQQMQQPQTPQQSPNIPAVRSTILTNLWSSKSDIPGVVPLLVGLSCPMEQISKVLHKIYDLAV